MENYSPTFTFKGDVRAAGAPQGASSLVRKQDVSSLSFISSIDSGSSNYLAVDSDGKLSVSNLLISDVTVNSSETSLANYISNNSSEAGGLQEGDVLILSGASGGTETYIIHGTDGSNSANYSQIQSGLTSAEVVAQLSAGAGINISGAGQISSTITQYTDSNARAALSAGTGLSYNSSTGQFQSTITQYTDTNARAALSSGTGISYNSSTGQISSTITQYTDSAARAAVSASGDLSYNNATGVFNVITYKSSNFDTDFNGKDTDDLSEGSTNKYFSNSLARGALSAGAGISYNSTSGAISLNIAQIRFTDTINLVANTALTINHALNEKFVHVSLYKSDGVKVDAQIVLTDANSLKITSVENLSGAQVVVSQ